MAFSGLIRNQVRSAFRNAGDLVKTATLSLKVDSGFDFGTGLPTLSAPQSATVKCILFDTKKRVDNQKVTKTVAIFLSEEVSGFSDFDTVTIEGVSYTPEKPFVNTGYTFEIELVKRT